MRHGEDTLHTRIWRVLKLALPENAVAWSAENRGNGPREGGRRKARGCVPGVPDLHITYGGRTLFIEIKVEGGVLSKVQKDMHGRLREAGAVVTVCRSVADVLDFLAEQGVPMRAKVMA